MGGRTRGPGPRSMELLRWVERLEVAGIEPLALAHRLGLRAVHSHVQRLAAAGLVERIYDRNGSVVAITRAGRTAVRPEVHDPRAAAASLAGGALTSHARATSWTAARATLRGMPWVSDREIRSLPGWQVPVIWTQPGRHRSDLGVLVNGARVAVEVELSAKAARRLHAIMAGYQQQFATGRLAGVLYVVDNPAVRNAIERTATAVAMDRRRLRLLELETLQNETRALGSATVRPQPRTSALT